jgi:hypothetical protein
MKMEREPYGALCRRNQVACLKAWRPFPTTSTFSPTKILNGFDLNKPDAHKFTVI